MYIYADGKRLSSAKSRCCGYDLGGFDGVRAAANLCSVGNCVEASAVAILIVAILQMFGLESRQWVIFSSRKEGLRDGSFVEALDSGNVAVRHFYPPDDLARDGCLPPILMTTRNPSLNPSILRLL